MSRLVETLLPARLGISFRWLVGSTWVANMGDGIMIAAGPLLVASQTRSPILVSMAVLLQRLPWMLFGLLAGALADRLDRRVLVMVADGLRVSLLAALCLVIGAGDVSIGLILGAVFLYGVAETFADTTSMTLTPMLVQKRDLGIANARIQAGFLTANQLVGPPIGAALFAAGMIWPFAIQAICGAIAVVLISRIATPPGGVRNGEERTHLRRDIAEGVRWLIGSPPVRTLALVIVAFNVTWGAAWSVLVLWSLDVLHMGEVGFGLLTTAAAAGGLVGTFAYGTLEKHVPLATLMRGCLLIEVAMYPALALATAPWLALGIMFGFGAYAFVWGTLSHAVRQRAVPTELQGRVASVYVMAVMGGLVAGTGLGGVIAQQWGLTAPFWFAFVGAGLTLALVWRELGHIAHADTAMEPPGNEPSAALG